MKSYRTNLSLLKIGHNLLKEQRYQMSRRIKIIVALLFLSDIDINPFKIIVFYKGHVKDIPVDNLF